MGWGSRQGYSRQDRGAWLGTASPTAPDPGERSRADESAGEQGAQLPWGRDSMTGMGLGCGAGAWGQGRS